MITKTALLLKAAHANNVLTVPGKQKQLEVRCISHGNFFLYMLIINLLLCELGAFQVERTTNRGFADFVVLQDFGRKASFVGSNPQKHVFVTNYQQVENLLFTINFRIEQKLAGRFRVSFTVNKARHNTQTCCCEKHVQW